ncbi:hypothetical protein [Microvirga mediterraneensis]|uniref:Uncharacterized protein n=1 Tax=Microvirga mediterraneensis TaxID=2754695 RepID=A0A838BQT9_9HYPH|nr:hypothetical protein [Microvirga mediterraneensis]MBA1157751.1 hypothetical protein [Microvirga mediterraneensis]
MARRMVLGHFGGGLVDFRISRSGFDAMTANVADRTQISFALSRDVMGRVASAGSINALDSAVSFSEVFPAEPPVLFGTVRNSGAYIDEYRRIQGNGGRYQDGTPYCAVVTTTAIRVTNAAPFGIALSSGDKFVYMAVA